ncbi:cell division protein FtsX [Roseinatronobacter alkalisoli]|uniref:Cell division protein FtsX n=1 Tax=Roseinatronobacter alkalisoli TaxID=3028235 RepID=A0ABT5TAU4_9RHOB|nr:FtsX-like permease family protein [Roseinatronobacter sp. HJB301]MDD7971521.1 cell division protein FtsX [Roseinatronobacter sp. HJB301]
MSPHQVSRLVVPRSGRGVWLVSLSAAAMAFLAVFALALSVSAARLAQNWAAALAQTATVRVSAPPEEMSEQTAIVLEVLRTTPGIASAREMTDDEQADLLEAWLGPDLPLDALPLPRLIDVTETPEGPDRQGLRLRLSAEAPGAVYDDHTRWRRPLAEGAARMRQLANLSLVLIGAVMAAIIMLAASASLASNAQVISVLRLVGAQDRFIARAFVWRMTLRATLGAAAGTALGAVAIFALPDPADASSVLSGLGFQGSGWLLPLALPVVAAVLAWVSAKATAFGVLRGVT